MAAKTPPVEEHQEQGLLILVLEIDSQVTLTGDLEGDAKQLWLHLHKKILEPVNIDRDEDGRVRIGWKVRRA